MMQPQCSAPISWLWPPRAGETSRCHLPLSRDNVKRCPTLMSCGSLNRHLVAWNRPYRAIIRASGKSLGPKQGGVRIQGCGSRHSMPVHTWLHLMCVFFSYPAAVSAVMLRWLAITYTCMEHPHQPCCPQVCSKLQSVPYCLTTAACLVIYSRRTSWNE